ncbi:MAG: ABC transporter substrate-binding protein [Planctomycetota bacterium]|jgi:DNA-binding LacI/PurR family transcriptional regulator
MPRRYHLSLIFLLAGSLLAAEDNGGLHFAYFGQLNAEHPFFRQSLAFQRAVANDLNCTLTPYFAEMDQIRYQQQLTDALEGRNLQRPIDGLVFMNMKQQETKLLNTLDQYQVPAILHISAFDYSKVGRPREQHPNWIGHLDQDNTQVGYQLAKTLITTALACGLNDEDGRLHLFAVNGNPNGEDGRGRERGLRRAVAEYGDQLVLHQCFHATDWSQAAGQRHAEIGLRRYPQSAVIWSGNDDIALGVIEAIRLSGRQPGKDVLTGGIDGTLNAIRMVQTQEMTCTYGALFMHAGWATILLHDYLHGIDFVNDIGTVSILPSEVIDQQRATDILTLLGDLDWSRIDFKRFSKVHNPELTRYRFNIDTALEQLR